MVAVFEVINGVLPDQALQSRPVSPQAPAPPSIGEEDALESDLRSVQYLSPVYRLDIDTQKLVLQYRHAETGDPYRQIPSEAMMDAYRDAARRGDLDPIVRFVPGVPPARPGREGDGADLVADREPAAASVLRREAEATRQDFANGRLTLTGVSTDEDEDDSEGDGRARLDPLISAGSSYLPVPGATVDIPPDLARAVDGRGGDIASSRSDRSPAGVKI